MTDSHEPAICRFKCKTYKSIEEVVVVPCHGGMVEESGLARVPSSGNENIACLGIL